VSLGAAHSRNFGDDFHLGQVAASSMAREGDVPQQWQGFAQSGVSPISC
jgi:hypothetical protein